MTASLAICHGNFHNEESGVTWLRNTRDQWDSASVNEGDRLIQRLHAIPGTRLVVTDQKYDRAQDTSILVNTRHEVHDRIARKVSKALGKPGSDLRRVAPARTLTAAFYQHPLAEQMGLAGVCHITIHPDAGPKQLYGWSAKAAIVVQYVACWIQARKEWKSAKKQGYLPVLTTDGQMGKVKRPWSPIRQAVLLGAKFKVTPTRDGRPGIDWVLYDRRLRLTKFDLHDLFDHVGFIAHFVWARRAKKPRR